MSLDLSNKTKSDTHVSNRTIDAVTDNIRGVRDALAVQRVFGEPYRLDGLTVIPVARVAGGAGGGGGEGSQGDEGGSGFGTGFGLGVTPVGVYEISDTGLEWKPTVDVGRLAKGAQILFGILSVCVTLVVLRRN